VNDRTRLGPSAPRLAAAAGQKSANGSAPLPGRRVLQAALRTATEHLARELATPQPQVPHWTGFQWRMAEAAAAIHGAAPLLSARLRWEGPPAWEGFLRTQCMHTLHRHERLEAMLIEMGERLREQGVAAVPLKGAALHALGIYRAGERPMADLDILVREVDQERTAQVLVGLGLTPQTRSWKEQVFAGPSTAPLDALGEHSGRAIKVELHTRIWERLPCQLSDITDHIFPTDAIAGFNDYPSLPALMAHLLAHAAGCMVNRSLRLLHAHDLALVSARMSAEDWRSLLSMRTASGAGPWWALPPLVLMCRYYGPVVPDTVLTELNSSCRWPLRSAAQRQLLSDVSHTRLGIEAFPGLEWSRSLRELVGYMQDRIGPGASAVQLRQEVQQLQDWGVHSPWCQLPQGARMLRWLLHRPLRPPSMYSVLAALGKA